MAIERRVIDGKEIAVEVTIVDGKEVITPVPVNQEAIDRIWKEMKEGKEKSAKEMQDVVDKLQISEEQKVDLVDRIKALEDSKVKPAEIIDDGEEKHFGMQANGTILYPETEEDWDNLIIERPTFGTDLRNKYNEDVGGRKKKIKQSQLDSALKVANEILPDMYKKDAEGKLVIDKNGHPVPDEKSDTYKVYCQIAAEEGVDGNGRPVIFATKNGPELIALKVKQVQGTERETVLKQKADNEAKEKEKIRQQQIKDGKLGGPGHQPPPKKVAEIKFSSDFEKQRAEAKVAQGLYKSLQQYCDVRDNAAVPYGRGNV